jgi:hypothetical protein
MKSVLTSRTVLFIAIALATWLLLSILLVRWLEDSESFAEIFVWFVEHYQGSLGIPKFASIDEYGAFVRRVADASGAFLGLLVASIFLWFNAKRQRAKGS